MPQQPELIFMGKICSHCGKEVLKMTEVEGKLLCDTCLNTMYFYCTKCKKFKLSNFKQVIRDSGGYGKIVCKDCFTDFYSPCEHCGYGCNKADNRMWTGHSYCRFCYDQMFTCPSCNQKLFREYYYEAGLCKNCWEDERRAINPDHLAKVPNIFQGKGPHFFGVELEVEVDERLERRSSYAKKILKLMGNFIMCKHDGSIKDPNTGRVIGFEIVTIPASRQVHYDKWNLFFENLPKGLRSYDTNTCGLHVHCSRNPLTPLTIAKMLVFINSKENAPFITIIAGRAPNQFCKSVWNKGYKDASPDLPQDRYEALNLHNRDTVEFRIFRGTLKKESMFKSIEFCDALLHFCSGANYSIKDCRLVDKYVEYVTLNKKEYLHLWAFICARWFREETKLTQMMGFPLPDKPAEVEVYANEPNPEIKNNPDGIPHYGNPLDF